MQLRNVNIIGKEGVKCIMVEDGVIRTIVEERLAPPGQNALGIDFAGALAFPGLINSHDHLDFNLFSRTGNRIYNNYIEWGADIQSRNKNSIDAVLNIPKQLRVEWGIYKNVVNGITTVINHGEYPDIRNPLINIFGDCYSLHSVALEKAWRFKLNRPFAKDQPFVIHVGEGTDASSFEEINKLIRWNLFKRRMIAVHGVSMDSKQARAFEALIWCPDSNFFLLNSTAKVNELKKTTKVLFGTDSTVTAGWNLWDHLRLARKTNMLSDHEIFDSLTSLPASVWGLQDRGALVEGKSADIVVAKRKDNSPLLDNFFQLNPEDILLILNKGELVLFDESIWSQFNSSFNIQGFSKIVIGHGCKYVKGRLDELIKKIKESAPGISLPFNE